MSLPTITFMYITAGQGNTGTSGEQLANFWKSNFDLIKTLLVSLDEDVQSKITSNEIKEIKVEDGVAYFTTDGENWTSLGPSFANLSGAVEDNAALVAKFANYVTVSTYTNAVNRISNLESNVTIITTTLNDLNEAVTTLNNQMNSSTNGVLVRLSSLEDEIGHKITSSSVLEIRQSSNSYEVPVVDPETGEETTEIVTEYFLEYTTDGENWNPISGQNVVEWKDIIGNIEENEQLMNKFDIVQDAIDANSDAIGLLNTAVSTINDEIANIASRVSALETSLSTHTANHNNPHEVTKAQVGLGNADNTADSEKPVSNPQQQYIDQQDAALRDDLKAQISNVESEIKVIPMLEEDYEALETKDPSTIYMITDLYQ